VEAGAGVVKCDIEQFGLADKSANCQHDRIKLLGLYAAHCGNELCGIVLTQIDLTVFLVGGQR
jgi:hypothetical protein